MTSAIPINRSSFSVPENKLGVFEIYITMLRDFKRHKYRVPLLEIYLVIYFIIHVQ